jgi:thioredoxin reductase (NADPH)
LPESHFEKGGKENKKAASSLKVKTLRSEYLAKDVILAPGKVPNNLGVENEIKFQNKGVHYCTKCGAPFYHGEPLWLLEFEDIL